jgi:PEP-CTERM motif
MGSKKRGGRPRILKSLTLSTDGTNSTSLGAGGFVDPVNSGSFVLPITTIDFSAISALDHAANVFLRYTFLGASSGGGHNEIDNIQINATFAPQQPQPVVPEPSSIVLAGFGALALCGFWRGQRTHSPSTAV